jgi:hypothetical protein
MVSPIFLFNISSVIISPYKQRCALPRYPSQKGLSPLCANDKVENCNNKVKPRSFVGLQGGIIR